MCRFDLNVDCSKVRIMDMSNITKLRKDILGKDILTDSIKTQPKLYRFLGRGRKKQAHRIANLLIPDSHPNAKILRDNRKDIFQYIVDFLRNSTLKVKLNQPIGKGMNLAKYPYLAPTGLTEKSLGHDKIIPAYELTDEDTIGDFRFQEQYRWDTYFQNKLLKLIGGNQVAIHQLMNLVEVFKRYGRIPNALSTEFLSHPQPPFEALAAMDFEELRNDKSIKPRDWYKQVMETVEQDLVTEWWDYGSGRIHPRQDKAFHALFGDYLTRYVSVHFHPLLAGCQDGKDHHWITAHFGENYLSVQLNCLVWANVNRVKAYYASLPKQSKKTRQKVETYSQISQELKAQINQWMWVDSGKYRGFRNCSFDLKKQETAAILYGDLSAEIFPLFVGLATEKQAQITMENLKAYYEGDIGLATTSPRLRDDKILSAPDGWSPDSLQWEVNSWGPMMIVAVEGLLKYGKGDPESEFTKFAVSLQQKWVAALEALFYQHDERGQQLFFREKMKFQKDEDVEMSEGYYSNLPGFGWTIASYALFLNNLAKENHI